MNAKMWRKTVSSWQHASGSGDTSKCTSIFNTSLYPAFVDLATYHWERCRKSNTTLGADRDSVIFDTVSHLWNCLPRCKVTDSSNPHSYFNYIASNTVIDRLQYDFKHIKRLGSESCVSFSGIDVLDEVTQTNEERWDDMRELMSGSMFMFSDKKVRDLYMLDMHLVKEIMDLDSSMFSKCRLRQHGRAVLATRVENFSPRLTALRNNYRALESRMTVISGSV